MEPGICVEDFRVRDDTGTGPALHIRPQAYKSKTLLKEGWLPGLSGGHSPFPLPES